MSPFKRFKLALFQSLFPRPHRRCPKPFVRAVLDTQHLESCINPSETTEVILFGDPNG